MVSDVPKPMAPIAGRPFLEYQLDYWIAQGVTKVILSVGYMKESIIGHFNSSYRGVPIEYYAEDTPLGTGGAVWLAGGHLDECFLLVNGDTFFPIALKELLDFHKACHSEWTFSLFRSTDIDRYKGFVFKDNGEIYPIGNRAPRGPDFLVNGGVYLLEPSLLRNICVPVGKNVSLEHDLVHQFLAVGGKIYGREFNVDFIDIGTPTDYARAQKIFN